MKKKILFINGHLDSGGCERSLIDVLKKLDYKKYEVDLLLLEHTGDYLEEVPEEVNIKVKNIKYFDSQPWPYPNSIMIGFTAEYESGEIKVDGEEILHADWYSKDNLPILPDKTTIARRIIDSIICK